MMDEKPALKISGLTRSFGRRLAVDSVDLAVARGEILGFLGPNGAGKTTLMNLVMGLLVPDGGEIELLGVKGGARTREVRLRVGYLQEKPRVYPEMSAWGYLDLFARLYGVIDREKRVGEVLARVGLSRAADMRLATFSRGMQQRVCLARVMLHRPEFLLLDEPTLGLDPTGVAEMREILLEMRAEGTTLFFSSHQLAEMERICDRVAFMKDGRLVAVGTLAQMLPAGRRNVMLVEIAEEVADRLDALCVPGCQSVRATGAHSAELVREPYAIEDERGVRAAISRALSERGLTVLAVKTASPGLEDIFLALDRSGTRMTH